MTRRYGEADFLANGNIAGPVGDLGAVERVKPAVFPTHLPQPHVFVETVDTAAVRRHEHAHRLPQGTILLIGSSIMSVAPASFSSGINLFIVSLGTTVSTA